MSALKRQEERRQQRQRARQRYRVVNRRQRKVNRKFSTLDFVQIEPSPLDVGFGEVLHAAIASLWRRKLLVGAIIATTLALGTIAVFVIPPSYKTEAYIRGGFVASNAVKKDDSKSGPYIGVDLERVIGTQSRLLQSQDLARRVVQQLGLEQLRPELSERHWLPDMFYGAAANIQEDETDRAANEAVEPLVSYERPAAHVSD